MDSIRTLNAKIARLERLLDDVARRLGSFPARFGGGGGVGGPGPIPVRLTQTAGGAGDLTNKCTFEYTAKDWATGTVTIATGLRPVEQVDYDYGMRLPATSGQLYTVNSAFVLFAFEDLAISAGCLS